MGSLQGFVKDGGEITLKRADKDTWLFKDGTKIDDII